MPYRTVVDGVPVNWIDTGEPKMSAILTFGVGYRDEQPHTVGLSHLVEHLAMRGTTDLSLSHNATTDPDSLQFFASGDPQQIVQFLSIVCAGISGLRAVAPEVVSAEKRIVAAELARGGTADRDGPYRRIYGLAGIGLAEFGQPALSTFTSAMVAQFAERWLHSGNALLTLTGALPPGLSLPLPSGARIERTPHPQPVLPEFPCWISVDGAPLSLTVVTAASWAARVLAAAVLEKALYERLRTQLGLIYSTTTWSTRLDATYATLRITLDPEVANVERVMVEATDVVRQLVAAGVDLGAINRARSTILETLSAEEAGAGWLLLQATNLVRSWPSLSLEQAQADLATVTYDDLRAVWNDFARHLVVATRIDRISRESSARLNMASAVWVPHRPDMSVRGVFTDVLAGAARVLEPARDKKELKGHQLHISADHLTVLNAAREVTMQVAVRDVVLLRRYGDGTLWFDFRSGLVAWIKPSEWKDPNDYMQSALARIPYHCVINV